MCDAIVINSVKERMLSRRQFFKGSAAFAAGATIISATTTPAMAAGHSRVVDLTHTFSEGFPTWGGASGLSREQAFNFADNGFNLFNMSVNEHAGTHVDAPLHFSADGASIDEVPVGDLVCPLCVVDISARAADDPDARMTPDDLKAWIAANGDIPDGACVAMYSGWDTKTAGDGFRNADGDGVMHFPGVHVEAAQMLLEETGAMSIGVDTLSIDFGPSQDFVTHYAWLPEGRYAIECMAALKEVPAAGATLVVGAPKVLGGTGGQARIFAMV
ncbi:MAG: cyclase family protein [Pseudomonadota bacterium]